MGLFLCKVQNQTACSPSLLWALMHSILLFSLFFNHTKCTTFKLAHFLERNPPLCSFHRMFFGSCHCLHRTAVKACQSPGQACVLDSQGTELREQGKCSNLPTLSRAATHSVGSDRAFTSPSVWSPLCVQPVTHILVTISPRASSKLEPKGLSALCKGEPAHPAIPSWPATVHLQQ